MLDNKQIVRNVLCHISWNSARVGCCGGAQQEAEERLAA
jgi:hypothetical protein